LGAEVGERPRPGKKKCWLLATFRGWGGRTFRGFRRPKNAKGQKKKPSGCLKRKTFLGGLRRPAAPPNPAKSKKNFEFPSGLRLQTKLVWGGLEAVGPGPKLGRFFAMFWGKRTGVPPGKKKKNSAFTLGKKRWGERESPTGGGGALWIGRPAAHSMLLPSRPGPP